MANVGFVRQLLGKIPLALLAFGALTMTHIESAHVLAQTIPDAGSLLRQQQQNQPPALSHEIPGTLPPEENRPTLSSIAGKRIHVNGFQVTGSVALFPDEEFKGLLKSYTDRDLTLAEIQEAAGAVTRYYREHGYFLARAYVPKQEIANGVVIIAVIEGRIEGKSDGSGIVVKGDGVRLDPERIRGIAAAAVHPGEPVNQDALERGVLLLNDLPGITAKSGLEQGHEPGSTKLTIDTQEGPLVSGTVSADNFGSRYTGQFRTNAGANLNDPFGRGDILSLNSTFSTNGGLKYLRGDYHAPVGDDGLKLGASLSGMSYELGQELTSLNASGWAMTVEGSAAYPIVRTRAENLTAQANYDHKILYNRAAGATTSDKRLDSVSVGLVGDATDSLGSGGVNQATLTATYGRLDLGNWQADAANDAATARTAGRYAKLQYSLGRIQRLDDSLNLFIGGSGQFSNKNLDSSEKFQLGGASGLRAYPSGEAAGDSGHKLTAELRWELPIDPGLLPTPQVVGFYDHGWICQNNSPWAASGQSNCYTLKGAGVGLNMVKTGSFELRASYALKIGGNPGASAQGLDSDGTNKRGQYWLQFSMWF